MALLNRQSLKNYFKKGNIPSEKQFEDLIDSTINVIDDGISREGEHGFRITPTGKSNRLISFFQSLKQLKPEWSIILNTDGKSGLKFQREEQSPSLFLKEDGKVGVGTENPKTKLDVAGFITSKGRIGSFLTSEIPGDGKWHDLISNLSEPCAFELMARIDGAKGSGRYALAYAIALNTFGGRASFGKIHKTRAFYGSFFNRIRFRWNGQLYNYSLQIKTARHYGLNPTTGEPFPIRVSISSLIHA